MVLHLTPALAPALTSLLTLSSARVAQGIVYPPELLEEVISWCVTAGVHLISDEVSPSLSL
jgi:threonine aldolase